MELSKLLYDIYFKSIITLANSLYPHPLYWPKFSILPHFHKPWEFYRTESLCL